MRGFTLIELMVAMLLGLVVIGGVVSMFATNQQIYRSNKALGDVQDNARVAFEMMARDIRTVGLTGCGNSSRISNVVNNNTASANWFADWTTPLIGYTASQTDPAAGSGRLANTESLILRGAEGSGVSVKSDSEPAASIVINESSTNLLTGDLVVICDPDHAAIMQLSSVANTTLNHATTGTPGNCTLDLSYPTVCASTSSYVYSSNALVARLTASDWYVATSAANPNGTSLFRKALQPGGGVSAVEMVSDVTGMALKYHQSGGTSFVTADAVTDWSQVDAVQITLTMISVDRSAAVNGAPISRTFTSTTTLRNRVL